MTLKYEVHLRKSILTGDQQIKYTYYGRTHKINGPAVLWNTGEQSWLQYDKYHRTNGPAIFDLIHHYTSYYHRGKYVPKI